MRPSSLLSPALLALCVGTVVACGDDEGGFAPTSTATPSTTADDTTGTTSAPDLSTTSAATLPPNSTVTTEPDPTTTSQGGESSTAGEGDSSSGGGDTSPRVAVFTLNEATSTFTHSITHPISEGPEDIDWDRWAVLHDGSEHRLYFLPEGRADEVYQYAYNLDTSQFEYGFKSLETIAIQDSPAPASSLGVGMAYLDGAYHLYFTSADHSTVYEYGYDAGPIAYVYGFNSTPMSTVTGAPAGTDWTGWGAAGGGTTPVLYAFASNAHDAIVRFERPGASTEFTFVPGGELAIDFAGSGVNASVDDFAVLDDGATTALYVVQAG